MDELYTHIDHLIQLMIDRHMIDAYDTVYMRNRLLAYFKVNDYTPGAPCCLTFYETLDALAAIAIAKGQIEDTVAAKDIFTSTLLNLFLDKPSVINTRFWERYSVSPEAATDYFYNLSQCSNYIKVNRIAKNVFFTTPSPYGPLQITINLSKPEKDPKEIAQMKLAPPNHYPPCLLCVENEGYEGTLTLPDRANHRMVRLDLNRSDWLLQYSPYLYYQEHCIVLSAHHTPMQITSDTFYNLLNFTRLFPHYFIGSNADLPIVGGSILSHEHYQGGRHTFPMDGAKTCFDVKLTRYPTLRARVLHWPLSTIELKGTDTDALVACADHILSLWKNYSDVSCGIVAYTDSTPHHTITPICKRDGDAYSLRLVLRDNRTDATHPLGIFHPHADVHHIKKENIGLIEVMGLAILPGRLREELEQIKAFIVGKTSTVPSYHLEWANSLQSSYNPSDDLDTFIKEQVGIKFARVLEDAGVYKLTPDGIAGFKRFVHLFGSTD